MRVGLDATPLRAGASPGVRRAVEGWRRALSEVTDGYDAVVAFVPGPGGPEPSRAGRSEWVGVGPRAEDPRAVRRAAPDLVRSHRIDVWLSPWSAFPRVEVPVVATVHEVPFVRWGPVEGRWRTLAHRWWLARDVASCAALVVPAAAVREDVLRLHPEAADRVHVVPHAFDPTPWEAASPSPRGNPAAEPRPPYAVMVGVWGRRKGFDVWAEAARRLPEGRPSWVLVLPPGAPGDVRARRRGPALLGPLGRSGVRQAFLRRGPSDEDLADLLRGASLLVLPSRSEGFGFPALEAMAVGLPVLATTGGALPEVCADAALLVPPGDPDALAQGVRRLLDDEGLRHDLVARGRLRARAFPVRSCGERLLAVLRRATAGGPS